MSGSELPSCTHNLPAQTTPFVGRKKEVEAVTRRLLSPEVRLLTLTGPGGIGKTRLALAVAGLVLNQFLGGTFLVILAPLRDPDLVIPTIGQTLGLREMGAKPMDQLLTDYLRGRQVLLLLDNFEPVVKAAPQVARLLEQCPELKLLITSREVLRISAEQQMSVPSLSLPEQSEKDIVQKLSKSEAGQFFLDRARSVKEDFTLNPENAPKVAEICRRLDGLPLAIQLAAAWVKLLSPRLLLERLERRLPLLTGGPRDLPERLQTMRQAIAWSYDLLDRDQQKLFRRLSVFVGGCTLEAAEAVCNAEEGAGSELVQGLNSLVDKSLVSKSEVGGETRLLMMETIREFGQECLEACGEVEVQRARHARFFRGFSREMLAGLMSSRHRDVADQLEKEHDNFRAVLHWSLERGDLEEGLRLAGSLGEFWWRRGYLSESRAWLSRLLTASDPEPSVARAGALAIAGTGAWYQSDFDASRLFLEQSLVESRALLEKETGGTEVVRSLIALALCYRGSLAMDEGDYHLASRLFEEGLVEYRDLGIGWGTAMALAMTAWPAWFQGDYSLSRSRYEEALARARECDYQIVVGLCLMLLGRQALLEQKRDAVGPLLRESLLVFWEMREKVQISPCLATHAFYALGLGQARRAGRLLGSAIRLMELLGFRPHSYDLPYYENTLVGLQTTLGEAGSADALSEGRAMSLEQAIAYALEEPVVPMPAKKADQRGLSRRHPGVLSGREEEIAELIAQGLTNRQIAEKLVISPRTVDTHVFNVLRKLNLNSRTQLVAWTMEHGLHSAPQE